MHQLKRRRLNPKAPRRIFPEDTPQDVLSRIPPGPPALQVLLPEEASTIPSSPTPPVGPAPVDPSPPSSPGNMGSIPSSPIPSMVAPDSGVADSLSVPSSSVTAPSPLVLAVPLQAIPCTSSFPPSEEPSSTTPSSSGAVDPPSLPSGPSPAPGPSSTTAGPPIFAPSWRVHSTDSGLRNRAVAQEVVHHTWLPTDAQTLRPVSLEVLDRNQSAAIYQLIYGSNHYHRMLSTTLDRLLGAQAAALESQRLMVVAQNERDAAVAAKAEMEGQLKVADKRLVEAEERFIKAEDLAQEVEFKCRVVEASLDQNRRWLSEENFRYRRLDEQFTTRAKVFETTKKELSEVRLSNEVMQEQAIANSKLMIQLEKEVMDLQNARDDWTAGKEKLQMEKDELSVDVVRVAMTEEALRNDLTTSQATVARLTEELTHAQSLLSSSREETLKALLDSEDIEGLFRRERA
ncbi:hypothetical protein NE237_005332 [Protea cynaroides]|uniref:Uncharacterized protein n=1 Tax=Protea cynaroides TaxID=273540 RepID=A0A9Q0KKD2_9MAGN|nr:hypothetical protein NE237_005332 [Protea cynaroides]